MVESHDQMGVGCGRGGRRVFEAETNGARLRSCWLSQRVTRWQVGFEQQRKGLLRWSSLRMELKEGLSICSERKGWMMSSWERANKIPDGYHEYIDVIIISDIININLIVEFEIARPTTDYMMLLRILSMVFVDNQDLRAS
ncbi:hypothetical protein C4D60_Mb01t03630 [Musa balbisiana]|uniref:Uncharacterized protein n=1 Tax=Musa balbisiana TaxID=52838 RepID=A0A4V6T4G4_MUSBA|nr:hypothetical protein C4D60_Mb01t03630 [Musa balbisiana]